MGHDGWQSGCRVNHWVPAGHAFGAVVHKHVGDELAHGVGFLLGHDWEFGSRDAK